MPIHSVVGPWMCKLLHFLTLKGNCHFSDHNASSSISPCSFVLKALQKILASSANYLHVFISIFGMSFMKSTNNIGPITEPCGTPLFTGAHLDTESATFTRCLLFDRNEPIHFRRFPFIPYHSTFLSNLK